MRKRIKRPSHGTVVAYLALFVALGGGAMAASHLGRNSVGARQLKKNAVTTRKIRNGAVTAAKVRKNALTGAQIDTSTLGPIPNADHARTADDALRAGTADSVRGTQLFDSGLVSLSIPSSDTDPPNAKQLFTDGPISVQATCKKTNAPSVLALIQASSTDTPLYLIEGGTRFKQANPPPAGLSPVIAADPGSPNEIQPFLLFSAGGTSLQAIGTAAIDSEAGECLFRLSAFG